MIFSHIVFFFFLAVSLLIQNFFLVRVANLLNSLSTTLCHYGAVVVVGFYYYLGSLWTVIGTNGIGL